MGHKHIHRWRFTGWQGGILTEPCGRVKPFDNLRMWYRCKCGAWCFDLPTEEQRQDYLENHSFRPSPEKDIHAAWHEFMRKFTHPWRPRKKTPPQWKWTGHPLMQRIRKWYATTPYKDFVQLVGCDDDSFSSSLLVLIDHRSTQSYMGCSMVYVPQNSGGVSFSLEPSICFLYPDHRAPLQAALAAVGHAQKVLAPIERRFQEEQTALHRTWQPSPTAEVTEPEKE